MIEITEEQTSRVNAVLSGIKGARESVFNDAINRGLATIRAETGKQIRTVYAISQKNLRTEKNVYLRKANRNNLAGEISFSGCKIPLFRFDVSPKKPTVNKGAKREPVQFDDGWRMVLPGVPVSARQKLSSIQTLFEHAFIATMSNGHTGMFERKSRTSPKITEIMGSSVAQMAGNTVVIKQIEEKAHETIEKRIEHGISRILNGYGG